jgi:hypothetical protein
MAAYIDLNPVRAGIVEDPKDYRFCGYAEAVACSRPGLGGSGESPTSGQLARKGIGHIWRLMRVVLRVSHSRWKRLCRRTAS